LYLGVRAGRLASPLSVACAAGWAWARTSSSTPAAAGPGTGLKRGPGIRLASSPPTSRSSWPTARTP